MRLIILYCFFYLTFDISAQSDTIKVGDNLKAGNYLNIGKSKFYFETYGHGDPLVLLHGGSRSMADFKFIIPELSKYYKVYAIDMRGHGRSTNVEDTLSYMLETDDIIAFFYAMKIDSAVLVGHSDGGIVALLMAAKVPQKVVKVIAAGANYTAMGIKNMDKEFVPLTDSVVRKSNYWNNFRLNYLTQNPNPGFYLKQINLLGKMWVKDEYITKKRYAKISKQVMLVFGDRDIVKHEHMIEMYKLLKNKPQLCILPNTSHDVFQERPRLLLPLMLDFLKAK